MIGKRHSSGEIAEKLEQARELAAKGNTQKDIARLLGVSVMTFHRWRKQQQHRPDLAVSASPKTVPESPDHHNGDFDHRLDELQLENARLRRLVADLLLEKLKLEEELGQPNPTQVDYRKHAL